LRSYASLLFVLVVIAGGCVDANVVQCSDGTVCPSSLRCAVLSTGSRCVTVDRIDACEGKAEGEPCTAGDVPASCHADACLDDVCGNGLVDASEVCDDGNPVPGDECSLDCRSKNVCGNMITDTAVAEECDEANPVDHDGCSSGCRDEFPHWRNLDIEHPHHRRVGSFSDQKLRDTQFVYDAARRRIVLFGGRYGAFPLNETWEWDGLRWEHLRPARSPSTRYGHQMAYDAARSQVVLFSGASTTNDTWTWDGGTWTLHEPAASPPRRRNGSMTYDERSKRIVLFGGVDDTYRDDTWAWDGSTWSQLAPAMKPAARSHAFVAYDPSRGVLVLFGGRDATQIFGDTWELAGDTWTMKSSTGPSPRFGTTMTYDPTSHRIVLVDGEGPASAYPHDAYAWDGSAWTSTASFPGTTAEGGVMTTDAVRGVPTLLDPAGNLYELVSTGWVRSLTGSYSNAVPQDRLGHVGVTNAARRELVVFGGTRDQINTDVSQTPLADTWVWNGQWRQIAGTAPPARFGAAAAYDPVRKKVVVFGGCTDLTAPALGDMWLFDGAIWTSVGGTLPPARCLGQMAFDAKSGRIVLEGGENLSAQRTDTWTWDGTTWRSEVAGPGVSSAAMGYDELRQRVILFGGSSTGVLLNDTWEWDGAAWSKTVVPGAPSALFGASAAWDRGRGRLVMFGGRNQFGESAGLVWEWDGTRWDLGTASEIGVLESHSLAPDPDGAGVIAFGGLVNDQFAIQNGDTNASRSLWRLRWDGSSAGERCSGTDADLDGTVDCADPDCSAVCVGCGDGVCDPLEQCTSCPADCGACAAQCGDFVCSAGETCAGDCE
jgi:cysteine-rich repeat protein